jgi:hypothetical protein
MLPLVIVQPIKTGSLTNRYRSVSGRARHVIVIEGHRVKRSLIMLVFSLPPHIGDFLFG